MIYKTVRTFDEGRGLMERIDYEILRELILNGRASTTEISNKIKVPRTTVHYRIMKMIKEGIIEKFSVKLGYEKLGYDVLAYVLATYDPSATLSQKEVVGKIKEIPGVEEVYIITGEWDFLVKVRCKSVKELGKTIVDKLREIEGISQTMTCLVLHEEEADPFNVIRECEEERSLFDHFFS